MCPVCKRSSFVCGVCNNCVQEQVLPHFVALNDNFEKLSNRSPINSNALPLLHCRNKHLPRGVLMAKGGDRKLSTCLVLEALPINTSPPSFCVKSDAQHTLAVNTFYFPSTNPVVLRESERERVRV